MADDRPTSTPSEDTPAPSRPSGAPSGRRRGRHARRRLALALLLLVAATLLLSRSALVRWVVEPRLSAMLGGKVAMGSASISLRGTLTMRDVRLIAPGAPPHAATALEARRIVVRLAPGSLLSGAPRPERVTLFEPVVRISQSTADGSLTAQSLVPTVSAGAGGALPSLEVVEGVIELGEHDDSTYSRLFRLPISGDLTPSAKTPDVYLVRFQGLPDESPVDQFRAERGLARPSPTILEGEVNTRTLDSTLRLSNVDLASWGTQWAPSAVRDRWAALEIEGRLSRTEFTFSRESGAAAEVSLEGVGLTLPVSATGDDEGDSAPEVGPPSRNLRMTDVTGTVRFDRASLRAGLTGVIEDLKYRVIMTTEGLALSAPFRLEVQTTEPFTVGVHPSLLPFAPPVVRQRFQTFSGPTAVVEAQVTVTRGPPTEAGVAPEPTVSGGLRFRDGMARYERFPYPISNLEGLVRFTDKEIRIESITGSNPSGARLHAEGVIAPPTDGAQVDLQIAVVDLPLDAELEEAMPESRKGFIAALFDMETYQRRVGAGLLQGAGAKAEAERRLTDARTRLAVLESRAEDSPELRAEVADLERRVAIPVFDPGARALVDVHVTRALGKGDGMWTSEVSVRLPRAGLFPREFPYPCEVTNGSIHFTDYEAEVEFPKAAGPTGGEWSFVADATLMDEQDTKMFRPRIIAIGRDVPVDALLLEALPAARAADAPRAERADPAPEAVPGGVWDALGAGGAPSVSVPDALAALGLSGRIDCQALVEARAGDTSLTPELGFDARVVLRDVGAAPAGVGGAAALSGLFGTVVVSEREVRAEGLTGRFCGGALTAEVLATFAAPQDAGGADVVATAGVLGLDLSAPIESFVRVFAPDAADRIAAVRAEREPAGRVDATLDFRSKPASGDGDGPDFLVAVSNARWLALGALGGRAEAPEATGTVRIRPAAVEFDAFGGEVSFDGEPAGDLRLDGGLSLDGAARSLRAVAKAMRIESPLVRALRASAGSAPREAEAPGALTLESLRGVVDAEIDIATGAGESARYSGVVAPRSLAVERAGATLAFDRVEGLVRFDERAGRVEGVRLAGDGLSLRAEGGWTTSPSLSLEVRMDGEARSLDDRVRALLPAEVLDAASSIDLSVRGPVALEHGVVRVAPGETGESDLTVSGSVRFADASARFGVSATEARGVMAFEAVEMSPAPGGDAPARRFDVSLDIDSARIAGLSITDGLARIRSGAGPGEILAPVVECTAHGGRIAGDARVGENADGRREFEIALVAGGVALGPAIRELRRTDASAPDDGPGVNRGEVDASLSMRGLVDDPASRSGRGRTSIAGGELIDMPVVTRLIELSNLAPPLGGRLREADAEFHIDGALVRFDSLRISSDSVALLGEGALRYPEMDVDMRFTSRGTLRIPLLSDLFEGVRDEIVTITMTGPLAEPRFGTTTLAGTRAMMGDIFRPDPARASGASPAPAEAPERERDE